MLVVGYESRELTENTVSSEGCPEIFKYSTASLKLEIPYLFLKYVQ